MSKRKIGILIPTTTHMRPWKLLRETHLYNTFLKSFLITYDKEHEYIIYLIMDDDDKLYSQETEKKALRRFIKIMKNVTIRIISSNGIPKGWVTHMWNRACENPSALGSRGRKDAFGHQRLGSLRQSCHAFQRGIGCARGCGARLRFGFRIQLLLVVRVAGR